MDPLVIDVFMVGDFPHVQSVMAPMLEKDASLIALLHMLNIATISMEIGANFPSSQSLIACTVLLKTRCLLGLVITTKILITCISTWDQRISSPDLTLNLSLGDWRDSFES